MELAPHLRNLPPLCWSSAWDFSLPLLPPHALPLVLSTLFSLFHVFCITHTSSSQISQPNHEITCAKHFWTLIYSILAKKPQEINQRTQNREAVQTPARIPDVQLRFSLSSLRYSLRDLHCWTPGSEKKLAQRPAPVAVVIAIVFGRLLRRVSPEKFQNSVKLVYSDSILRSEFKYHFCYMKFKVFH